MEPLNIIDRGISLIKGLKLAVAAEYYAAILAGVFLLLLGFKLPESYESIAVRAFGLVLIGGSSLSWPIRMLISKGSMSTAVQRSMTIPKRKLYPKKTEAKKLLSQRPLLHNRRTVLFGGELICDPGVERREKPTLPPRSLKWPEQPRKLASLFNLRIADLINDPAEWIR